MGGETECFLAIGEDKKSKLFHVGGTFSFKDCLSKTVHTNINNRRMGDFLRRT